MITNLCRYTVQSFCIITLGFLVHFCSSQLLYNVNTCIVKISLLESKNQLMSSPESIAMPLFLQTFNLHFCAWVVMLYIWLVHSLCADVVNRVRNGESIPFRPQLPESSDLGKTMLDMIRNCWNENPEHRPTFQQIRTSLRKMTNGEWVISTQLINLSFNCDICCLFKLTVGLSKTMQQTYRASAVNLDVQQHFTDHNRLWLIKLLLFSSNQLSYILKGSQWNMFKCYYFHAFKQPAQYYTKLMNKLLLCNYYYRHYRHHQSVSTSMYICM